MKRSKKRANEKAEAWISGVEKLSSHPIEFKEMKGMGKSGNLLTVFFASFDFV